LNSVITEVLGDQARIIDDRLKEKWGIPISQTASNFEKFDDVIHEYFDQGADKLNQIILNKICNIDIQKNGKRQVKITNSKMVDNILNFFDRDCYTIFSAVNKNAKTVNDIVSLTRIPITSCYRKTNILIDNGFLIEMGYCIGMYGKRIPKYKTVFDTFYFKIHDKKKTIWLTLNKPISHKSLFIQTMIKNESYKYSKRI
jgi:hypothetical protein